MATNSKTEEQNSTRIVAVIDIGASSVRMLIAQILPDQTTEELESLSQTVSLGRDSFMRGEIRRETIEDCVQVLRIYRQKLREYSIDRPEDVRVVATSAVREADNRLAFQDRIYIATGFAIEPFDEASLHRTTYIGIKPILDQCPELQSGQTVVCEVGGGTTEILALTNSKVTFANTYRLGSLRLIKTLEAFKTPLNQSRGLVESQINKIAHQIRISLGQSENRKLVVMGGDMRLAASKIDSAFDAKLVTRFSVDALAKFTDSIIDTPPETLVSEFQMPIGDATSFAPALMANLQLAKSLDVDQFIVASVNLREGLIKELLAGNDWIGRADEQILQSAVALGQKFNFDIDHAKHVDHLVNSMFQQMTSMHQLGDRWRLFLRVAALLHEVGLAIGQRSYHKHSMYIIRNSSLFGFSSRDLELVALIARYHRRALPQLRHVAYSNLNRDQRASISKLSAILRVCKALDASRNQRVPDIQVQAKNGKLRLSVAGMTDLSLEQLELRRERVLFENIFGMRPELSVVPLTESSQDVR